MHYDDARLDSEASPRRPSDRTLFRHLFFTPDVVWPLLRLLDAGVMAATGLASYLVRHDDVPEAIGLLLVVVTTLVAAHTLGASKLYDQTRPPAGFLRRCRKTLSAWLITIMVMLVLGWATKSTALVSRLWIGTWMIGGGAGLIAVRVLEAWFIERANHLGLLSRRVGFIVPPTVEGLSAFKRLLSRVVVDPHLEPCGIYLVDSDDAPQTADLDVPVRGSLDALETDIAEGFVQEVVIVSLSQGDVLDGRSINAIRRLPARCAVIINANAPPGSAAKRDRGRRSARAAGGLPAVVEQPTGAQAFI